MKTKLISAATLLFNRAWRRAVTGTNAGSGIPAAQGR
jgi:hypothetical protein